VSVMVLIRVQVDPAAFVRVGQERANDMIAVSHEARSRGALHHCFIESDGAVVVIDEWESAEAFQAFFEENDVIPQLLAATGAQGAPEVSIHPKLDTPDTF
jgi:heme-degrading monooxygenase HmoA